jgi:hypothetical protein
MVDVVRGGACVAVCNNSTHILIVDQVHTGRVHLSVAVVNYRTKLKKTRRGLCTAYLASLAPTPEVLSHTAHAHTRTHTTHTRDLHDAHLGRVCVVNGN